MTASTGSLIPAIVDPAADLGRQKPGSAMTWLDSLYFTSQVKAEGREFGLQVHTTVLPNLGAYRWTFALTDKTTGRHEDYEAIITPDEYQWTEGRLDIKAPGLSWTGDATRQSVQLTAPFGTLDVELTAVGPALKYASTGHFLLIDVPAYQFALPEMRTSGTLVVDGTEHTISGTSWLDRQWGEMPMNLIRWTWTYLCLPNGDKIGIWDAVGQNSQHSWATVLQADGSYRVVEIEPLAKGASEPWTSPDTGQRYPTRWQIRIPQLRTELTMQVTGPKGQEILSATPGGGYAQATAAYTGTYNGESVSGENYVDMNGDWRS